MNWKFELVLVSIWGLLILGACGIATPAAQTAETKTPPSAQFTPVPKAGWEQQWDKILAEAKKEREILVYTNLNSETKTLVSDAWYWTSLETGPPWTTR